MEAGEMVAPEPEQTLMAVADDTLTTTLILQQTYRQTQAEAVIMHSEILPLTVFNMPMVAVEETERLKAAVKFIVPEALAEQEDVQASARQAELMELFA